MKMFFPTPKLRHLASLMVGVWVAFFILVSLQACGEFEEGSHSAIEVHHGSDSHEGVHQDLCCQPQISTHDVSQNSSPNGTSLYKLAILLFLPIAFLLPVLSRKSGAVPDRLEFPPPRSNPFLATIRLLI